VTGDVPWRRAVRAGDVDLVVLVDPAARVAIGDLPTVGRPCAVELLPGHTGHDGKVRTVDVHREQVLEVVEHDPTGERASGDRFADHDAILAAARLLKANGAPGDYARALRAYNNSPLYVDAVTRYAKQIQRDRHAVYFFYCFGP
jgi:hypothetical protein